MGLIPTNWTGMLYRYMVSWLKLLPVHNVWWTLLADGKMVLLIPISGVSVKSPNLVGWGGVMGHWSQPSVLHTLKNNHLSFLPS